jgi:nucleoside-diphosphate-sugar epimerase
MHLQFTRQTLNSARFITKPTTAILRGTGALRNMSSGKRIVFTGGSGKAGRHVIPYLLSKGHKVLNLDLIDFPDPSAGVFTLKTDLTKSGQVFNALTTHFNFEGYEEKNVPSPPDAVIHFAAYARNMLVPDDECYAANVTSTYNVIEAACKLGVRKVTGVTSFLVAQIVNQQPDHCGQ